MIIDGFVAHRKKEEKIKSSEEEREVMCMGGFNFEILYYHSQLQVDLIATDHTKETRN